MTVLAIRAPSRCTTLTVEHLNVSSLTKHLPPNPTLNVSSLTKYVPPNPTLSVSSLTKLVASSHAQIVSDETLR
jgi:hypothetical protein